MGDPNSEGRSAWMFGLPPSANPYLIGSREFIEWATGWRAENDAETARRIEAFNRTYEQNAARRGQYNRN